MGLTLGLVGLPNAGKTTLFNALTRAGAPVAPYPFTTIEPNLGQVAVPDPRLQAVAGVIHPKRVVPATVRFIDIAGLVAGASRGEGLGNRFLAHIREVNAIVHVVRCFTDAAAPPDEAWAEPVRDAEIVETELALADLESVERATAKAASRAKAQDAAAREQGALLARMAAALSEGVPARRQKLSDSGMALARELRLLTAKPVIYVANLDERLLPDGGIPAAALRALSDRQGAAFIGLAARLEAELNDLPPDEAREYMEAVGLAEPGVSRLIRLGFATLGLVSFFTVLSDEVRAWPIPQGTAALGAAGEIHTDMAHGFIRAEVIAWDALVAAGGLHSARDHGAVRTEGRDYQVRDGDVITFRFAV